MNFGDAMTYVLRKVPVTRASWKRTPEDKEPPILFAGGINAISAPQTVMERDQKPRSVPRVLYVQTESAVLVWLPTFEAIFAEDWEVFEFTE